MTLIGWVALLAAALTGWRLRPRSNRRFAAGGAPVRDSTHAPPGRGHPRLPRALASFRSRRLQRRREAEVIRELPDSVDLLVLSVSAGLTVPLAMGAVAERSDGVVAEAFSWALSRSQLGVPLADALESVPGEFGEPLRQLVRPLVVCQRYGSELLPALETLAVEVRRQRRHRAEVMARRLPVKLLFPLVLCILPAFALLTVVPVIASSLQDIRL